MEVLDERECLLSDFEVSMVLQQMGETSIPKTRKQQAQNKQPANLLTVVFEVKTFLNGRPGSQQNAELVEKFLTDLATFPLTKAERLQILNLRPASIVELHVIIEECDERFSETRLQELLNLILTSLPPVPVAAPPADEAQSANGKGAQPQAAATEK